MRQRMLKGIVQYGLQLLLVMFLVVGWTSLVRATTYYSQGGGGDFTGTNVWDTQPDGAGSDYTAGTNEAGNSFVIQSGDVITLTADQTLDSLIIHDGGDLVDDDGSGPWTLFVIGNFTVTASGSYTATGVIDFIGSGSQQVADAAGVTFPTFRVTKSGGTLTAQSSLAVGPVSVFGGTFTMNGFDLAGSDSISVRGGTLTLSSGNHDVTGLFLLESGTCNAGSGIITFVGNFTKTGGTFNEETAELVFNSNTPTITTNTDIAIDKLTTKPPTAVGSTRVLTLAGSGGTRQFTINTQYERGERSLGTTLSSATLVYAAGATLLYTQAGAAMTVDADEWPVSSGPDIVENAGSHDLTLDAQADRSISQLIVRQTGATRNFRLNIGAANTLTIDDTLQRKTTGTAGITILSGTLAYGAGATLMYNPSSPASVTVGAEWPTSTGPANVVVNNSGNTVTGSASRTISRKLDLQQGTLSLGSNTLTVLGDVAGSEVAGSASIADATTLSMGNGAGSVNSQYFTGNITLNKLTVNKTGGANDDSNTVRVSGTLTFTASGALTVTAGTLFLDGDGKIASANQGTLTLTVSSGGRLRTGGQSLTGIGTISASSGTIVFDGSSNENMPTGITIGTLEVNNASGVTATSGTLTVGTSLVLTSGIITTTSSNRLQLSSTATVSGTPGATRMVVGPLRKAFASGDAAAFTYPIGFSTSYRPATFDYSANDVGTSVIEIQAVSGDPGGTPPSGIAAVATSHYYTILEVGTGGTFTYDLTLTYTGTGFTPDSRNKIILQNGAGPTYSFPTQGTASGGTQTVTGLTALPTNSGIAALGAGGAIKRWQGTSGNWSVAANWEDSALPLTGDEILLNNALQAGSYTVTYDASTSATSFDQITISGTTGTVTLQLDKFTTIDLTNGTTGLTLSNNANSVLVYNGTSIGMNGGAYNNARTSIGDASTVEYRTGTIYSDTYGDLTVNTTGSLSSAGDIVVNADYTKQGSGSHDVAGSHLSVTGSSDIQAGTLSTSGTGRVTLGAVTNAGTVTLNGSGISTFGSGGGAVSNTGSMTFSSTAGSVTFSGNYSGSGTLSATSATPNVTFDAQFNPGGSTTFGSQTLDINGTMNLTGGTFTPSSTTTFSGATLALTGGSFSTSAGTFTFDGASQQTVSNDASLFNLRINNTGTSDTADVRLQGVVTVNGTLTFTDGIFDTKELGGTLVLAAGSSVAGSPGASSHVNGAVRGVYSSTRTSHTFNIGSSTRYRPITLAFGSVTGNPTVTLEQFETGNQIPLTSGINSPLAGVSRVRSWTMTYNESGGSTTSPTIQLTWNNAGGAGISDGVWAITGSSTSADVVVAQQPAQTGNWSSRGQSGFTGTYATGSNSNSGTVTSTTALTLTDGQTDNVTFGALSTDVSLPVELSAFEATELRNLGHIQLNWTTESEIDNAYWLVQRKVGEGEFETITTINGQGTKTSATDYQYLDMNVQSGDTLTYRLADVSFSGAIAFHFERGIRVRLPDKYELVGNYPNPFNPTTTISYRLPKESRVHLTIYNMLGQKVRDLVPGTTQSAGIHRVVWDGLNQNGSSVSTGIYIYRLQAGDFRMTRKMTFMK